MNRQFTEVSLYFIFALSWLVLGPSYFLFGPDWIGFTSDWRLTVALLLYAVPHFLFYALEKSIVGFEGSSSTFPDCVDQIYGAVTVANLAVPFIILYWLPTAFCHICTSAGDARIRNLVIAFASGIAFIAFIYSLVLILVRYPQDYGGRQTFRALVLNLFGFGLNVLAVIAIYSL